MHLALCKEKRNAKKKEKSMQQSKLTMSWWRNDHDTSREISYLDQWLAWGEGKEYHIGEISWFVM